MSLSGGDPFPELEPVGKFTDDGARRPVVLLVEDEASLGELLVNLLARINLRALHAGDGGTALQQFAARRGEVVLAVLDCHLPDMDGSTLAGELRRCAPGLPLLLTSGRDQRALQRLLAQSGPTAFLPKPFTPPDVLRQVNALLSQPG